MRTCIRVCKTITEIVRWQRACKTIQSFIIMIMLFAEFFAEHIAFTVTSATPTCVLTKTCNLNGLFVSMNVNVWVHA